jgi:hypothetical protein
MTPRAASRKCGNAREVRYARNPEILKRRIEDTVFLVNPEDDTIFYLNPLSAGIWHLLAEPTTPTEAIRIVQQAFKDTPPEQIASDVRNLFEKLKGKDLIRRLG